ncbi:MAG: hypothetical protein ACPGJV_01145 [Bacteriovoracaceae bacterium]
MSEKPMNVKDDSGYEFKAEYKSHKIPFVIKLVWVVLILWGLYYSFKFAVPDLNIWLAK